MPFVFPKMLHIKKLIGMHNKRAYTRVFTYAYTRIDIRVYAKYERIIHVCVVRIYLSCTVFEGAISQWFVLCVAPLFCLVFFGGGVIFGGAYFRKFTVFPITILKNLL